MSIIKITHSVSARVVAGAMGIAMAVSLLGAAVPASASALTSAQVSAIVSLLQSFGADATTIANVQASLTGGTTTTTTSSSTSCSSSFTRDLTIGSTGSDVKTLQQWLNSNGYTVSASGAGSAGMESTYFGAKTQGALSKYQVAKGITPTAGYFGPKTRASLAASCSSSSSSTSTTTTTTPTGPGITVSAAAQPANSLAPQGSSRVPFTAFTLTNNTASPVVVTSVTVLRSGLAQDAAFSGVLLLDSNGLQVGIAHTFNSNHQANIGDGFTLAAGASMTYTVSGNMAASLSAYTGQVASLQVVAVNTSVPVTGSLPVSGASQTLNSTLSVGTVSTSTSSYDPGAAQTKNIGDTNVRLSGVRFTAGSTEDLKLYSVRWRQVGTASASDIGNVVTVLSGGASYPTTVDSTGKYYTTSFPNGILIPKGNAQGIHVQADMSGSNAANRTVEMDIDKVTDIYFVGQLYGYGIAPSGTYTPWYKGFLTTVNGGSVTSIQNAASVASANIPVNVPNTTLGGFQTNFLGEPVSVTQMIFSIATSSTGAGLITSVSIVDQNGTTVAGPVDASGAGATLTFTDTVTFPVGTHTYTLKGKLPSGLTNGGTITLSTTPSSQWTSPTGQTTGNSVSLPGSLVTMNAQTVKAGSLTITASPNPVAQNIVAGVVAQTLGNIQLDASQSGEDIRLNTLPVSIIVSATANAGNLNSCQLYNGATPLNSGSNVVNPTTAKTDTTNTTTAANTFTFDNALTIPKGTVLNLGLDCNIVSGASLTSVSIGVLSTDTFTSTGVQSGSTITPTATTGAGGVQTIATKGTLTATAANASVAQPSLSLVADGTIGVTQGFVKFHATNENISLTKIGLTLANGTYGSASNGAGGTSNSGVSDVTTAYIYNGITLLGTATFTGTGQTATSTLTTPVTVPKDTDVLLTIKTDLATIGVSAAGGIGDTVKVDPLNAQGNGVASGQTINISATAGVNGVALFNTYPTVAFVSNTVNPSGTNVVLKKFTITANASASIGIYQMAFTVATTGASVTNLKLYGYTDSGYSQGISSQSSGTGQIGSTGCTSGCSATVSAGTASTTFAAATNPITIPAGTTYYFALLGTISGQGTNTSWNISPTLQGDAAQITSVPPGNGNRNATTTTSNTFLTNNNSFVWSDNATTTVGIADGSVDWTNGFQVPGLSSNGI